MRVEFTARYNYGYRLPNARWPRALAAGSLIPPLSNGPRCLPRHSRRYTLRTLVYPRIAHERHSSCDTSKLQTANVRLPIEGFEASCVYARD